MLKAIIFDIDGTILDTEKVILKSLQMVLNEELNKEYGLQDLRFCLGIPGREALQILNVPNIDKINSKWSGLQSDFSHEVSIFEGLKEVINILHNNNLKLGIVTSKTKKELLEEFEPFSLSGYFDQIICACDTVKHKPHPEPLLLCLRLLNVSKDEAVYIGDSIYDMQCSGSAGVKFALALWGAKTSRGFEKADCLLNKPSDILYLKT